MNRNKVFYKEPIYIILSGLVSDSGLTKPGSLNRSLAGDRVIKLFP